MARYQVSLIAKPQQWQPAGWDDVPAEPGKPLEVLGENDDVFAALRTAIEYNQASTDRWAVVVESGTLGRTWPGARLSTPIVYKVTGVWWPAGWEPSSTLDVPNCVWRAQNASGGEELRYEEAVVRLRALNQQAMDRAAALWYVIIAVENEPISRTVSYDPAGTETTVEVRRIHVVRPEDGGKGNCAHCPARSFDCAKEDWLALSQELSETHSARLS